MLRTLNILLLCLVVHTGCPVGAPDVVDAGNTNTDVLHDTDAGEDADPPVPILPGLGIDYDQTAPGAAPRYDAASDEWTARPWPSDRLLDDLGFVDLTQFPNPDVELLTRYLDYGMEVLKGWGLNSAIYIQMEGDVDMASLPGTVETLSDGLATVQLVNVTPDSARYGEQMPLVFRWFDDAEDPYLLPRTLAMRPVYGFPLQERATYCAVLTRGVKDSEGRYLSKASGFSEALDSDDSLAPLVAWLDASPLEIDDVAVATCFTTDEPTQELRRVRTFLEAQPLPALTELEYKGKNTDASFPFYHFKGYYRAPNFQAGEKPYDEAGDLRFDSEGAPIIQFQEDIRFVLLVPTAFTMPEDGWPVVLYAHGTGGNYETCMDASYKPAPALAQEGFAMICIDQPLHGERGWDSLNVELYSFNLQNPRAGRMNFRQSAIDTMSLTRMVSGGNFDLAAADFDPGFEVRFDPENVYFFGHSHGGLSGALVMAIEPRLEAGVLSGAGGVLVETVLRRKDPIDFRDFTKLLLDVPDATFDTFHPTMSVVQMLVDATDPINYAPYWLNPMDEGVPKHVFVTEGVLDAATPSVGTDAMCAAAGVPIVQPVAQVSPAHDLKGIASVKEPVGSNVDVAGGERRTAGVRQWATGDHFVAIMNAEARTRWRNFFKAVRFGTEPIISE